MDQHTLTLLGRATKDAEEFTSNSGKKFMKFAIAVNEYRGEELGDHAFFYDVVCFQDHTINQAKRIKTGDNIFVLGKPNLSVYENKDKETNAKISCKADYIRLYQPKQSASDNS